MKLKTIILFYILSFTTFLSFGQSIILDNTFGQDGKVITDLGVFFRPYSISLQPDNKIILRGSTWQNTPTLLRYNSNGSLDSTFNLNNIKVSENSNLIALSQIMTTQSNGKIITVGYLLEDSIGVGVDIVVNRYNPDGTPDSSFGTNNGQAKISLYPHSRETGTILTLQKDEKIIVCGVLVEDYDAFPLLLRLNSDGSLDNSFGVEGKVILKKEEVEGFTPYAVAIQENGKILLTGPIKSKIILGKNDIAVLKFNSDGTTDNSFGTNGTVITHLANRSNAVYSMKLQLDEKILVAGVSREESISVDYLFAQYNPDGTLDNSFGDQGIILDGDIDALNTISSIIIQPNGKILACGHAKKSSQEGEFLLFRYHQTGQIDSLFGENGKIVTSFNNNTNNSAFAMTTQSDGKIVVIGTATAPPNDFFSALVRYIDSPILNLQNSFIKESEISIYPNPTSKELTVEYTLEKKETLILSIYNSSGKLIKKLLPRTKQPKIKHSETIQLDSSLPSGSYFIVFSNGDQVINSSFIKL